MTRENDLRQYAPATQRNRDSILETLVSVLPPVGNILEIASGTGEHAIYFASKLKNYQWIPSEPDAMRQKSIDAWRKFCYSPNCQSSLNIDVLNSTWTAGLKNIKIIAIVNINMIHISPWKACLGLIEGAGNLLLSGGILYLYGPYKQGGKHTAHSNQLFDESLRLQNQAWGVRNLEDVIEISQQQGLKFMKIVNMPVNNLSVIFKKN